MTDGRERSLVLLFTVLGLGLRLAAAHGMDYWEDDGGTLFETHRIVSLATALEASPVSAHPPLSFLFAKAAFAVLGVSGRPGEELLCRLPFLLAGTTAIPLAWAVARRLLEGAPARLLVTLGTAASPLLLWCDRDLRGYALLVPLALTAVLCWLRLLDEGGRRNLAGFVASSTLALWDHYNAVPLVAALIVAAFVEGARLPAVVAGGLVGLLYLPWVPSLATHLTTVPLQAHAASVQLHVSPVVLTAPAYVHFGLVLGSTVFPWNLAVVVPVGIAGVMLSCAALARFKACGCGRATFLGLVLPVVGAALTTFKMPRYHVASVPFLLVFLGTGAEHVAVAWRRPRLAAALVAFGLLGMAVSDVNLLVRRREYHFLYPLRAWSEGAALVRARPAPVVVRPDLPFAAIYVPDLVVAPARSREIAPVTTAAWLLVDESVTEAGEAALLAPFTAAGLRVSSDTPLVVDPDHEARTRWVARGTRRVPVRLLRLERPD